MLDFWVEPVKLKPWLNTDQASRHEIPPPMNDPNLSSFLWSVANLLRGDYKQSEYGKVILSFTVLRRLDCVLEATKSAVLAEFEKRTTAKVNPKPFCFARPDSCSSIPRRST